MDKEKIMYYSKLELFWHCCQQILQFLRRIGKNKLAITGLLLRTAGLRLASLSMQQSREWASFERASKKKGFYCRLSIVETFLNN